MSGPGTLMHAWREEGATFLVAFVLALGLWWWVDASEPHVTERLRVELTALQDGPVALATRLPEEIEVEVDGPESAVLRYLTESSNSLHAYVDVSKASAARDVVVPVTLSRPPALGVEVRALDDQFIVTLEPAATRELPLERQTIGELPDDSLYLDSVEGELERVEVRGPERLVAQVAQVVYLVDLGLLGSNTTQEVDLKALDPNGDQVPYITFLPRRTLELEFVLRSKSGARLVPVVPQFEGAPDPRYQIRQIVIDPPQVRISSADPEAIQGIQDLPTAVLTVEGITRTVSFAQVTVPPPDMLTRVEPKTVKVRIEVAPYLVPRRFEDVPLRMGTRDPRLSYTVDPLHLDVTVEGPIDLLPTLPRRAVTATIPTDRFGPGIYELKVSDLVFAPGGDYRVVGIDPPTLTLRVVDRTQIGPPLPPGP